jgi:hypothetical protein
VEPLPSSVTLLLKVNLSINIYTLHFYLYLYPSVMPTQFILPDFISIILILLPSASVS